MRARICCVAATAALAALGAGASGASALGRPSPVGPSLGGGFGPGAPVFVQTDNVEGNQVVVYDRAANGTLTQAGVYATGGKGGVLEGSVVDHLASQSSLAYDQNAGELYAVNAGSDTISVFAVYGNRLALRQVMSSGGDFPVSIAVRRGLVYVLNALDGGELQGYVSVWGRLLALPGSARALGLNPDEEPQFTHTPGQVAFTPDGRQLIVTTKGNGSDIDVYGVDPWGRPSATPAVNPEPGKVPFAVSFDPQGHLIVAEAGSNALADFALNGSGTLTQLDEAPTGQEATCWVVADDGHLYASNAGSASLSAFQSSDGGTVLTPQGNTHTDAGTVDATVSGDGRFLYVQTGGAGIVDEYAIGVGGALSPIGSVTVPGAIGGEGIVAG
jgi:6-phosphogluconolactonase (cycloisomerase 2 family)